MTVRIECTAPGYEGTWVDVSSKWTRREFKAMVDSDADEWLELFHVKVEACHIETSGDPIEDPSAVNEESLDDVDMQVLGFLGTVLLEAAAHLRSLGFMSGRVSSNGKGDPKVKT